VRVPPSNRFCGSAAGPFVDYGMGTSTAAVCTLGGGGSCGTVAPKILALPACAIHRDCRRTGGRNRGGAMCRPGTFGTRMDFVIFNTGGAAVTCPASSQR